MVTPADLMVENKHYGIDIASQDTNTCPNQEQPRLSSTAFKNNFVYTWEWGLSLLETQLHKQKTQHMCVVFDWHIGIYL